MIMQNDKNEKEKKLKIKTWDEKKICIQRHIKLN